MRKIVKSVEQTDRELIQSLGQQLTLGKLKNMQKEQTVNSLGREVSQLKLEIMQLKGGA